MVLCLLWFLVYIPKSLLYILLSNPFNLSKTFLCFDCCRFLHGVTMITDNKEMDQLLLIVGLTLSLV